jgi:hypothetical protein
MTVYLHELSRHLSSRQRQRSHAFVGATRPLRVKLGPVALATASLLGHCRPTIEGHCAGVLSFVRNTEKKNQ